MACLTLCAGSTYVQKGHRQQASHQRCPNHVVLNTKWGSYCKLTLKLFKKHKHKTGCTCLRLLSNAMKHRTNLKTTKPYSALHFAKRTALYGYNSVSSERVPYSFAVERGGRPKPNKNGKSCFFFLFVFKKGLGYSAWGEGKGSIKPLFYCVV